MLLGAAEYAGEARAVLGRCRRRGAGTRFLHVLSRANDPYDAVFRLPAPAPRRRGDRSLGVAGLGAQPDWLDLQLDHPALVPWLACRGIRLERSDEALSHWHFYADPGAMRFWRLVLRRAPGWSVGELTRSNPPTAIEPRWARIEARPPRLIRPRWPDPDDGPQAEAAANPAAPPPAGLPSAGSP